MRVDPTTVSTEGFIINLHAVLLRFAEPFLDAGFTKVGSLRAPWRPGDLCS